MEYAELKFNLLSLASFIEGDPDKVIEVAQKMYLWMDRDIRNTVDQQPPKSKTVRTQKKTQNSFD